ncbi:hypothetical protein DYB32_007229 [Aphanomyces invadans]|nr:hypothetical protein DYB32_007229 [Aphanomyces invadans]
MLQEHRYNRLVDHCRGKTLVNLALKIERLLYRDFPNDANVVLSPELLAMRVNRVIAKVLHLNRTKRHADHSRSYSIASMLNPVDCFE